MIIFCIHMLRTIDGDDGGFKHVFYVLPLLGKEYRFYWYFSNGLKQPNRSYTWNLSAIFLGGCDLSFGSILSKMWVIWVLGMFCKHHPMHVYIYMLYIGTTPHQDYEPFLGSGIPTTKPPICDWHPGWVNEGFGWDTWWSLLHTHVYGRYVVGLCQIVEPQKWLASRILVKSLRSHVGGIW